MNEQAIFLAAAEIPDWAERAAYLEKACAGDADLRKRVLALLAAHERSGEFLEVPACEQFAANAAIPDGDTLAIHPLGVNSEARPNEAFFDAPAEEGDDEKDERPLDFLQPSVKPGSLGRLGHYEVLELLGEGGFGKVVKAFDEKLHRVVAIKIMSPLLAATSPPRKRFLREARAAARIRHENVVAIHDIQEQPIPYLVMDYIPGETLEQKLDRNGPLDTAEALRIGQQIAAGLAAAHAEGLIHRDIKPANILLESAIVPRVKITDFGLARAADDASLTQSGVIAGTPMYMAPEQAQGVALDHRADLFSLGSVLYVMCCGRPPFRAATTLAVLKRVAEDTPRPIREILPEVPVWLCDLIAKLHAKQPADRFGSAQEVADLLERYLNEWQASGGRNRGPLTPSFISPAPSSAAATARKKRPWIAAAAVILMLACFGLGLTEATGVSNIFHGARLGWFASKDAHHEEKKDAHHEEKVAANRDDKEKKPEPIPVAKNVPPEIAPLEVGEADRKAAEYVLSIGGIVSVNVQPVLIKAAADLPDEPFRLSYVNLRQNRQLNDAGLANFKGCKNLIILHLEYTPISDAGLVHFKDCKELTSINFSGERIGNKGLVHFKDCKNLYQLQLMDTKVNDAGLAQFKDCKNLTILTLINMPLTDAGLAQLHDCKRLKHVKLIRTQITDAGLALFENCPEMFDLDLRETKVTAAGIEAVKAACPRCRIEWNEGVVERAVP